MFRVLVFCVFLLVATTSLQVQKKSDHLTVAKPLHQTHKHNASSLIHYRVRQAAPVDSALLDFQPPPIPVGPALMLDLGAGLKVEKKGMELSYGGTISIGVSASFGPVSLGVELKGEVAAKFTIPEADRNAELPTCVINSLKKFAYKLFRENKVAQKRAELGAHYEQAMSAIGTRSELADLTGWVNEKNHEFINSLLSHLSRVRSYYFDALIALDTATQSMHWINKFEIPFFGSIDDRLRKQMAEAMISLETVQATAFRLWGDYFLPNNSAERLRDKATGSWFRSDEMPHVLDCPNTGNSHDEKRRAVMCQIAVNALFVPDDGTHGSLLQMQPNETLSYRAHWDSFKYAFLEEYPWLKDISTVIEAVTQYSQDSSTGIVPAGFLALAVGLSPAEFKQKFDEIEAGEVARIDYTFQGIEVTGELSLKATVSAGGFKAIPSMGAKTKHSWTMQGGELKYKEGKSVIFLKLELVPFFEISREFQFTGEWSPTWSNPFGSSVQSVQTTVKGCLPVNKDLSNLQEYFEGKTSQGKGLASARVQSAANVRKANAAIKAFARLVGSGSAIDVPDKDREVNSLNDKYNQWMKSQKAFFRTLVPELSLTDLDVKGVYDLVLDAIAGGTGVDKSYFCVEVATGYENKLAVSFNTASSFTIPGTTIGVKYSRGHGAEFTK